MNFEVIHYCRFAAMILSCAVSAFPAYSVDRPAKELVTVRIVIEHCFESEKFFVPINRSFRRGGIGVGAGGNSGSCHYSYGLHAVRRDRNHVNLFINVTINSQSFEKQVALRRGKNSDLQLEHGVRIVAAY